MNTKLYSHVFGVINGSEFSAYGIGNWDGTYSNSKYIFSKLPKEFPISVLTTLDGLHHPFLLKFPKEKANILSNFLNKGMVITGEGKTYFPGYEGEILLNAVISSPKPNVQLISQSYHGFYEGPLGVTGHGTFVQSYEQKSSGVITCKHTDLLYTEREGIIQSHNDFYYKIPLYSGINKFSILFEEIKMNFTDWNLDISIKSKISI